MPSRHKSVWVVPGKGVDGCKMYFTSLKQGVAPMRLKIGWRTYKAAADSMGKRLLEGTDYISVSRGTVKIVLRGGIWMDITRKLSADQFVELLEVCNAVHQAPKP